MRLPKPVLQCIRTLEQAGFSAYAVGGCVRDALLGIEPHDYDLCTDAVPEQICRIFSPFPQVHNGEKHGTVGIVMENTLYEITTFRKEGGYADSRHPDWVRFVSRIEEDLARRDFTVNAMAYSPRRGYVDPWDGKADLDARILRAVGDPHARFREDALRILRGVRFSVRFGLSPDPATARAMTELAPLITQLAPERIFDELCRLLPRIHARELVQFAPILTQAIPELKACVGFDQHCPYHRFDVFTHTAHVVEGVPASLPLRWAALLHDVGKPAVFTQDSSGRGHFCGHAARGAEMADAILQRLKSPSKLRQQVQCLICHHMDPWETDRPFLRRRLGRLGPETAFQLLALQEADFCGKGIGNGSSPPFGQIRHMLDSLLQEQACFTLKDLQVKGRDLLAGGFSAGPELGKCLEYLLTQVQNEIIPNEKAPLLAAAADWKARKEVPT